MKSVFTEQDTIEYWDELYDHEGFYGDCYRQRMGTVLSWLDGLDLSESPLIMDAGCGAGRFAREAAKRGYDVIGMDYSLGMVAKAKSICNHGNQLTVAFLQGNTESLPMKSSSLDMIVCLGVIGYLPSEHKALHSIARALKPGGVLAVSIVNKARLAHRLDLPLLLIEIARRILNRMTSAWRNDRQPKDISGLRTYLIPEFRKSLELAGFQVLEYRTVPWKALTFCGKEVLPRKIATNITMFFEQFSNIPVVGSFGGMCIFRAQKRPLRWT